MKTDIKTLLEIAGVDTTQGKAKLLVESQRGHPGKPGWEPSLERAKGIIEKGREQKKSDEQIAALLYDMSQNVPKKYFLEFLTALKIKPSAKMEKELLKAKAKK